MNDSLDNMHAKPSIRHKTKEQSRPGTAQAWEAETAAFGLLGLAATLAIVLAVVSASLPARPSQLSAAAVSLSMAKDLGSGQLIADARTPASGK